MVALLYANRAIVFQVVARPRPWDASVYKSGKLNGLERAPAQIFFSEWRLELDFIVSQL
jgi:hypothetical protein